jgi:CheY-like chemotaxis protein
VVNSKHEEVLVIEDDPWVAAYIAEVVESFFAVKAVIAPSAAAARQLFHANRAWRVIISDLSLPGADGEALVAELLAGAKDIAVIFVTGQLRDAAVLEKIVGRPISLLLKPFVPFELKAALEPVIGHCAEISLCPK